MRVCLPKLRFIIPALCLVCIFLVPRYTHLSTSLMKKIEDNMQRYSVHGEERSFHEGKRSKGKFDDLVKSDYWIVVTSIAYPTEDIRLLAKIPGWKIVVVGDTKTPKDWSHPNCVYLGVDDQLDLGFETVPLVPMKSYARKNIGYLFAIAHGAKVIYETDDDNHPTDNLKNFEINTEFNGLVYKGEYVFNPYRHFGQPTLWPRGYPLSSVGENITTEYKLGQWKTPSIQQGVVNGDPDMDAIFRLTRKKTLSVLNVTFDWRAPPVIVPSGVFSPFNSQNTLFLYDALWALLLPTTTSFRVCDIWRGYWAQRLLWEMGGNLGFFPPNAFQKRNSHSYLLDAIEEKDLYFETERLLKFLKNWKCAPEKRFFGCVGALSSQMATEGFWKENDATLTNSWIRDLIAIGYKEPSRIPFANVDVGQATREGIRVEKGNDLQTNVPLTFWAAEQPPPSIYGAKKVKTGLLSHLRDIARLCLDQHVNTSLNLTVPKFINDPMNTYPNILLIVAFKVPQYHRLPLVEALYRKHFQNIVYCGGTNTRTTFNAASGLLQHPVTFMEVDMNSGLSRQRCLTAAMKMRFNVDGFLQIADDTLIDVFHLHQLPFDRIWYQNTKVSRHDTGAENTDTSMASLLKSTNQPRFSMFFNNLNSNTKGQGNYFTGWSNIVFVPRLYKDEFIYFTEYFTNHNLYFESVIPTVLAGIERFERFYMMPKKYELFQGKNTYVANVKLEEQEDTFHNYVCRVYFPLAPLLSLYESKS